MIPRLEYMLGEPLRHAWDPGQNKHPRFFRRGMMQPNAAIHHFIKPTPGARVIELPNEAGSEIVHFAYLDMAQFLDKINRYSTIEAQQSFARGAGETPAWVLRDMALYPRLLAFFRRRTASPLWALAYSALVFVKRYLANRGYRDGWRGFYVSLFWAGYFLANYAKLAELERVGTREEINADYHAEAERILAGYDASWEEKTTRDSARAEEHTESAPPRISVVINTLNEEANLPYALRSVAPWADEIVVVDMHSDDRTAAIAEEYGAKVYLHERVGFADPARAFAIGKVTGEWVLILDADELIPPALAAHLRAVARADNTDGINFPRLNYWIGSPLMHSCAGPDQDKQMRFFKSSTVRIGGMVHDFLTMLPGTRILDLSYRRSGAIVHFAYLDSAHILGKFNRYSTIEAQQSVARGRGQPPAWALREVRSYPLLPALFRRWRVTPRSAASFGLLIFINRYVKNGGYRDGWRGFYVSLFWSGYFLASYAKLAEMESMEGGREGIATHYRAEAERILAEYPSPALTGVVMPGPFASPGERG